MKPNDIESELSYAYLHAVAAQAGIACQLASRALDNLGIDATSTSSATSGSGAVFTDLSLQVSSRRPSSRQRSHRRGCHTRSMLKTCNRLRGVSVVPPKLLVVLFLPPDPANWLAHSADELVLRRCGYWMSLAGAPAIEYDGPNGIPRAAQLVSPDGDRAISARGVPGEPLMTNDLEATMGSLRPIDVRKYAEALKWQAVTGAKGRLWVFRDPSEPLRQYRSPSMPKIQDDRTRRSPPSRRFAEVRRDRTCRLCWRTACHRGGRPARARHRTQRA
ncbi:MAG: hypothetical protein U1F43_35210 [Myxococcota bacterium]